MTNITVFNTMWNIEKKHKGKLDHNSNLSKDSAEPGICKYRPFTNDSSLLFLFRALNTAVTHPEIASLK